MDGRPSGHRGQQRRRARGPRARGGAVASALFALFASRASPGSVRAPVWRAHPCRVGGRRGRWSAVGMSFRLAGVMRGEQERAGRTRRGGLVDRLSTSSKALTVGVIRRALRIIGHRLQLRAGLQISKFAGRGMEKFLRGSLRMVLVETVNLMPGATSERK